MSIISSLSTGALALQVNQNAINTTAHNLSNINTKGYTRQQVLLNNKNYNTIGQSAISKNQIGLGVDYSVTRQIRDEFLDKSFRKEKGKAAFYGVISNTNAEIENLLNSLNGKGVSDSIDKLWVSIEELKKDPGNTVTKNSFISAASQFVESSQSFYNDLCNYQNNLNTEVFDIIEKINAYAKSIKSLNEQIRKNESDNESANDLKDKRNLLIDDLSELINTNVETNKDGSADIFIEGMPLVTNENVFEIEITQNSNNFFIPVWKNGNEVFNSFDNVSAENGNDIGKLKALLMMRGDKNANYLDDDNVTNSLIENTQSMFDNLCHSLMTEINNILTDEKDLIDNNIIPEYNKETPIELFVRNDSSRYIERDNKFIYNDESNSLYTINNIKINPLFLKEPAKLDMENEDKSINFEKANKLSDIFNHDINSLNKEMVTKYNFKNYFLAMSNDIVNTGNIYRNISETHKQSLKNIDDSRQSILNVSSDEELANLIKFQNAYNAASRFINVINEMYDQIINKTGLV